MYTPGFYYPSVGAGGVAENGLPSGGQIGDVLFKISNDDYKSQFKQIRNIQDIYTYTFPQSDVTISTPSNGAYRSTSSVVYQSEIYSVVQTSLNYTTFPTDDTRVIWLLDCHKNINNGISGLQFECSVNVSGLNTTNCSCYMNFFNTYCRFIFQCPEIDLRKITGLQAFVTLPFKLL